MRVFTNWRMGIEARKVKRNHDIPRISPDAKASVRIRLRDVVVIVEPHIQGRTDCVQRKLEAHMPLCKWASVPPDGLHFVVVTALFRPVLDVLKELNEPATSRFRYGNVIEILEFHTLCMARKSLLPPTLAGLSVAHPLQGVVRALAF